MEAVHNVNEIMPNNRRKKKEEISCYWIKSTENLSEENNSAPNNYSNDSSFSPLFESEADQQKNFLHQLAILFPGQVLVITFISTEITCHILKSLIIKRKTQIIFFY